MDRAAGLAPPLGTRSDMPSRWNDVELSFDDAAQRILLAHQTDGDARDLPVPDLKTWAVVPFEGALALAPHMRHHAPMPLRRSALSALLAKLEAPTDFLRDRLPAKLQIATLNWLLCSADGPVPATLRLRGGEIAALVSSRYAPLDPEALLECLRGALERFGVLEGARVRGVATGMVDNLRIVLPSEAAPVKVGDVSHVGIDISTSSFGRSSIHVCPVVWRLVCTNGLRSPHREGQLSFRHVGDVARLRAGITEAIPTALAHARGVLTQWKRAVDFMIDDVAAEIEALRDLNLTEKKEVEAAILVEAHAPALPAKADLYTFVNAITAAAKRCAPERRLEVESVAGQLLAARVGGA
jgi:hypothetical protein